MNTNALTINEDLDLLARVPDAARQEALFWARLMARIENLAKELGIGAALAAIAKQHTHREGFSPQTLRRKWDIWRKSGKILDLVSRARFPALLMDNGPALPGEFIVFWKGLVLARQRCKVAPAHRELIRQWEKWRAGDPMAAIPGYEICPPPTPLYGVPEGWSYRNLSRPELLPTRGQRIASSQGRAAAKDERLQVFTTRKGLYVGQYYMFDDFWHDHKVNVDGERAAMRPLEFHALDLFSACKFAWGMQPMRVNPETGKQLRLKEKEMLWLVTAALLRDGYHPNGTTLIVEHGTAAIREEHEKMIFDLTAGKVTVQRSGLEGAAAFAGQFAGRSKGNPHFKAALESIGNLIHNELDALPGQVGKDRNHQPDELHGLEKYNNALIEAMLQLPEETRQLLAMPFVDFNIFRRMAGQIYANINNTYNHRLNDWEACELLAHEWRLDPTHAWASMEKFMELDPAKRGALEQLLANDAALMRVRRLSRAEVWNRGRKDLVRLPPSAMMLMLGKENAEERIVKGNLFDFESFELGPGAHRYIAHARDGMGGDKLLKNGQTYLTFVTPFWPEIMVVGDAKGRFLGVCQRYCEPNRADAEAIQRQMGQARHYEAEQMAPVAVYRKDTAARRAEMHRHNGAVLGHFHRVKSGKANPMRKDVAAKFAEDSELLSTPAASEHRAEERPEDFRTEDLL